MALEETENIPVNHEMEVERTLNKSETIAKIKAIAEGFMEKLYLLDLQIGFNGNLNSYTPFKTIHESFKDKEQELIDLVKSIPAGNRSIGCIVGMGLGDSIGAPFEFLHVVDQPTKYVFHLGEYSKESNTFNLKRGQWTDDASMGLCMADSLIICREYDGSDMRIRFWNWWNRGYNNAFKNDNSRSHSVGLGGNISSSMFDLTKYKGEKPPPVFRKTGNDAGNGSLMRLAAVPIFFQYDEEKGREASKLSSLTTHPGPIAYECCKFMSTVCIRGIKHTGPIENTQQFIEELVEDYLINVLSDQTGPGFNEVRKMLLSQESEESKELSWNWKSAQLQVNQGLKNRGRKYNGYPVSPGYYGAFSLDGLALALHCVYTTNSFETAITKCVNFCGDADSTASICGQMAGAIYGYDTMNSLYIENLNKWDDGGFALRGALLYAQSLMQESGNGVEETEKNMTEDN